MCFICQGKQNRLYVILGKQEREAFEAIQGEFKPEVQEIYWSATTFHDGKWLMFELEDDTLFDDMERLLMLKRKPNKK